MILNVNFGRAAKRELGKKKVGDGGEAGGCHVLLDVEVKGEGLEKLEREAESPGRLWELWLELVEESFNEF